MGHEYAHTRCNTISLIHSVQPQPVIEFIIYKLEGIGSKGRPAFITPRSPVRSRPPLPTFHFIFKDLQLAGDPQANL